MNENIYEKKYIQFSDEQIDAIKNIYTDWQTNENFEAVLNSAARRPKLKSQRKDILLAE